MHNCVFLKEGLEQERLEVRHRDMGEGGSPCGDW